MAERKQPAGGSRKGIPNKIGVVVKQNVIDVFDLIGGIDGMVKWAKRNRSAFYKLYARLIPTEIVGQLDIRDARQLSDEELAAIAARGLPGAAGEEDGEGIPDQVH